MFISKGRFGIKLVPMGKVSVEIQEVLAEVLQEKFRKKVYMSRNQDIPVPAYDIERSQFNSREIINFLHAKRKYKEKILGLMNEDIFKNGLPFVFGDASTSKGVALVSIWRFEQNKKFFASDPDLLIKRGKKEAIQQIGLAYGLRYCSNSECVMFNSHTVDELDRRKEEFCERCKVLL